MSPKHKKKKTPPWYIIIKLLKTSNEEKILKMGREKRYIMYRGRQIKNDKNFSIETMKTRRRWNIFKSTEREKKQTRKKPINLELLA